MKDLLQKIKSVFKKKRGFVNPYTINPHKHWIIILYLFSTIIILLILLSLFIFFKIEKEKIFQVVPVPEQNNNIIKDDLLKSVIDSFDKKEKIEKDIKTSPKVYSDPSL